MQKASGRRNLKCCYIEIGHLHLGFFCIFSGYNDRGFKGPHQWRIRLASEFLWDILRVLLKKEQLASSAHKSMQGRREGGWMDAVDVVLPRLQRFGGGRLEFGARFGDGKAKVAMEL
jgi:hypothetical protein